MRCFRLFILPRFGDDFSPPLWGGQNSFKLWESDEYEAENAFEYFYGDKYGNNAM
jgi:hypothetical protein